MGVPTQCPVCRSVSVNVTKLAPGNHSRGDGWVTRAECTECGEYVEWFD